MLLPADIWVILPVYNESKYIEIVLKKVLKITPNVVVVNDGSTDQSAFAAKKHTKYVLSHHVNLGKGAALKTGCEFAFTRLNARAVITMDSDDQHDASELKLFAKALETAPMVFGVRGFKQMPKVRVLGNKLLSVLLSSLFGVYIPDILSGYKAFTENVYQQIIWNSDRYGVELEIAAKVAKKKVQFTLLPIKTIYHDFDRGMNMFDAINILTQLISWRISL